MFEERALNQSPEQVQCKRTVKAKSRMAKLMLLGRTKYIRVIAFLVVVGLAWKIISSVLVSYHLPAPSDQVVQQDRDRLHVSVFYEAMCPDSKYFLTKQLHDNWHILQNMVSVTLVPYGKAKTTKVGEKYTFECQHGERECRGNKIHACGIKMLKDDNTRVGFAACLMEKFIAFEKEIPQCASKYGLDEKAIVTCADGDEGSQLLNDHGVKTPPNPGFIPTISIDDSLDDQDNLFSKIVSSVCNKYKGSNKHKQCPQT